MAGGGGTCGGILGLLDLIEEHRGAVEYDWRSRFGLGLAASVPSVVGWGEAVRLVRVLASDPSSQLAAALQGWAYPLERTGWMLADLIDVQIAKSGAKRATPYPRPTPSRRRQKWGDTGGRSRAEVVSILNQLGHTLPVEPKEVSHG